MKKVNFCTLIICLSLCCFVRAEDTAALSAKMAKQNEAMLIEFQKNQAAGVKALKKFDPAKTQFYLYSIDPTNRQGVLYDAQDVFYGFPVLGKVEIKPTEEKERLLNAFIEGVKNSDGMAANCFNPRHGLRLIQNGRKTDLVICYSCLSVEVNGLGSIKELLTSGSPVDVFNQFLDRYHIKKADKE